MLHSTQLMCSTQSGNEDDDFLHIKCYNSAEINWDIRAEDLCYDKPLIHLNESISVSDALEQLHETNSTCALVFALNDDFLGVLELTDVLRYILSPRSMGDSVRCVLKQYVVASAHVSGTDILKHMRNGIRYIAIEKDTGFELVSQRTIIHRIVYDDYKVGGNVWDKTVKELGLGTNQAMHSCRETDRAREAFKTMAAYGITSLPILNSAQRARGVISATDILYARSNSSLLEDTVIPFVRASRTDANNCRDVHCIVSCQPTDTLSVVLRLMFHEEVHHVYVIHKDYAIGVISFIDVLRSLVENVDDYPITSKHSSRDIAKGSGANSGEGSTAESGVRDL